MKLMILWVQFSRYTWFDLGCPVIFRFIPRHSTLDTFIIISFLPEPWLLLCFYFFIFLFLFFYFVSFFHDKWLTSLVKGWRSILMFLSQTFVYFWTLGSTSSMMAGLDRLLTRLWQCFYFFSWHVVFGLACILYLEYRSTLFLFIS